MWMLITSLPRRHQFDVNFTRVTTKLQGGGCTASIDGDALIQLLDIRSLVGIPLPAACCSTAASDVAIEIQRASATSQLSPHCGCGWLIDIMTVPNLQLACNNAATTGAGRTSRTSDQAGKQLLVKY